MINNNNIGKYDKDKGIFCGIFRDKKVWIALKDEPDLMTWDKAKKKLGDKLPDIGTLNWVYLNKEAINKALIENGGEPLKNNWYWSSSKINDNLYWSLCMDGTRSVNHKIFDYSIRSFQLLEN